MTIWKRAQAGRALAPSAGTHNGMIDAIQALQKRPPDHQANQAQWPGALAWLKNTSADPIPCFGWCEITAAATPHSESGSLGDGAGVNFPRLPYVLGEPIASTDGPARDGAYAVAQTVIEAGKTGLVRLRGVTWALMWQDAAGTADGMFLDPTGAQITSDCRAQRAATGPGRILDCPADAGDADAQELALINLEDPAPPPGPTTAMLFNGTTLNGESGSADKQDMRRGSTNLKGYVHFAKARGDLDGVGVDVLRTFASVDAGTDSLDGPSFRLTKSGLYRFHLKMSAYYNHVDSSLTTTMPFTAKDTIVGPVQSTDFQGVPSHAHSTDIYFPEDAGTRLLAFFENRASGAGSWTALTEEHYGMSSEWFLTSILKNGSGNATATLEWTLWLNLSDTNREFRWWAFPEYRLNTYSDLTGYVQWDFFDNSGLVEITRLADYVADVTL